MGRSLSSQHLRCLPTHNAVNAGMQRGAIIACHAGIHCCALSPISLECIACIVCIMTAWNSDLLKAVHRHIEFFGYVLLTPLRWLLEAVMSGHNMVFIYRVYSRGLGDTLAISAVLAAMDQQRPGLRAVVFSKIPELFEANPLVCCNLDYRSMGRLQRSLLKSAAKYFRGRSVICVGQEKWVLHTWPWQRHVVDHSIRWLRQMLPDYPAGFAGLDSVTTQVFVSEQEKKIFAAKFCDLPAEFSVIKATSNAATGFRVLKNWRIEHMQSVVNATRSQTAWVQIGGLDEPLLEHVIDMRGLSIRESIYLLSRARLTLTVEGFVSHAAATFGTPVIVIFSGYHDLKTFVYPITVPIHADPAPACAPCQLITCSQPSQLCMDVIQPPQVIAAVERALRNPGQSKLH